MYKLGSSVWIMLAIAGVLVVVGMIKNFRPKQASGEDAAPTVAVEQEYVTIAMYRQALQAADDAFLKMQAEIDALKKKCEEPAQSTDLQPILDRLDALEGSDLSGIIARIEILEQPHDWDVDKQGRCWRWIWDGIRWRTDIQAPSLAPDPPEKIGPPPAVQKCSTGNCGSRGCSTCRR